jgi:hypothetical protein
MEAISTALLNLEIMKAKNKIEALKMYGIEKIYFKGNEPYGVWGGIYTYHVYAIRLENGVYEIVKNRVN